MLHLEWLVLIGYIDSLFVERTEGSTRPPGTLPPTLNQLYLQGMRYHAREGTLLIRSDEQWIRAPDWRFDRHVIRVALYLQERVGVKPGDRVAIVGDLSREWLIAEFAGLCLGGVSAALDPNLPIDRLLGALVDIGPRVIFASSTALAKLDGGTVPLPGLAQVISIGSGPISEPVKSFAEVVDLGGTLDTAERANTFRAHARAWGGEKAALCHHDPSVEGCVVWDELTQSQAIERIGRLWQADPARDGDRVYIAAPALTLSMRLALHACVGDGFSTIALGSIGRGAAELAELSPHRVIADPAILEVALRTAPPAAPTSNGNGGWRERASRLLGRTKNSPDNQAVQMALGGRLRSIYPTSPVNPALAETLRGITIVGEPD